MLQSDRSQKPAQPTDLGKGLSLELEAMIAFVQGKGGRVRFDEFASEHLTGERGFYSVRLDIQKPGSGVPTPCASNPRYVMNLAAVLAAYARGYCEEHAAELSTRPLTFCEVGGGAGEFKRAFLRFWGSGQETMALPQLDYVSVDINPQHRVHQAKSPGRVIAGEVTATNLPDNSVDILFDEEVLDCLPFRVFHWDLKKRVLTHEAFVEVKDGGLSLVHQPIGTPDRLALHTEADLATRNYQLPVYRYAPSQWDYLIEAHRVLKPGGLKISTDYNCDGLGNLLGSNLGDLEKALRCPYTVDLTHGVDFVRLAKMAGLQRILGGVGALGDVFYQVSPAEQSLIDGVARSIFIGAKAP